MMMITKELIEKLSDENISKKEYDSIIAAIGDKVDEIWRFIIATSGRKLYWWAFSNDVSLGHGNGSTGGEFDPATDKDFIDIEGENKWLDNEFYEYNEGFPTRFLWEDYRTEVTNHVEDTIKKKKEDAIKKNNETHAKKELVESIKKKLTPEELEIIHFKS
jgi:hypothetical protein